MKNNDKDVCPVCGSSQYKYEWYSEYGCGIIEQHGFCEHCGYTIEQGYSSPIVGFRLDRKRGFKRNGKWYGRKRRRIRKKY